MVIKASFFDRSPIRVARDLLGKVLVRATPQGRLYLLIADTEAYAGPRDLASHARFGRTARNRAMYEQGGIWYVYMVYGIYWLLNAVTRAYGRPSAVLIRGGYVLRGAGKGGGLREMLRRAPLIEGPGKLSLRLGVQGNLNGEKVGISSGLWIEDWGLRPKREEVHAGPRIGVAYAGEWAHKDWRFTYRPRLDPEAFTKKEK